jgi:hypothetical protein
MSTSCRFPRRLATLCRAVAALAILVGVPLSATSAHAEAATTADAAVSPAASSAASAAASAATDASAKRDVGNKKLDENTRFDVQCEYVVSNSMRKKVTDAFHTFWLGRETLYTDPTICPPTAAQERQKDGSLTREAALAASAAEAKGTPGTPSHQFNAPRAERVMHGPGEVVIVVKDEDYVAALKDATEDKPLHLFLNGFDMGTDGDGSLEGVVRSGDRAALLFHAGASGKTSQAFWTDLYHQHGILAYVPLRASIGWGTQPRFVPGTDLKGDPMYVSVSDPTSFVLATLFGGTLILFFAWALRNSDTFRVAPLYPWWLDARMLQTQIHKAVLPVRWSWWPFKRKFDVAAAMQDPDSLLKIAEFVYGKYKDISLALHAELPVIVAPAPAPEPTPAPALVLAPPVDPTNPLAVAAAEAAFKAAATAATAAALAAQAASDSLARAQARIASAEVAVKLVTSARAALDADANLKQKTADASAASDKTSARKEAIDTRQTRLVDFGKALTSFSSGWDSFKRGGATPTTSAETFAAVIGLALFGGRVRPLRLPYSLVRVQWGAWMMFATTAAVYLWLVYGEFPALDGSVLGLVSVSTITAGASFIVDDKVGNSPGYSRGFVFDLMTGANDVQQAHRYQALVVNVLLFVVGIVYVSQHLAYPVFDPSWLGLMTLSGIAQTAGKGILEAPPDKTDGASKQAPAG